MEGRKLVWDALACLFSPYEEGILVSEPRSSSVSIHIKNYSCRIPNDMVTKLDTNVGKRKMLKIYVCWEITIFLFRVGRVIVWFYVNVLVLCGFRVLIGSNSTCLDLLQRQAFAFERRPCHQHGSHFIWRYPSCAIHHYNHHYSFIRSKRFSPVDHHIKRWLSFSGR